MYFLLSLSTEKPRGMSLFRTVTGLAMLIHCDLLWIFEGWYMYAEKIPHFGKVGKNPPFGEVGIYKPAKMSSLITLMNFAF
jgi:hypothetical protein